MTTPRPTTAARDAIERQELALAIEELRVAVAGFTNELSHLRGGLEPLCYRLARLEENLSVDKYFSGGGVGGIGGIP